MASGPDLLVQYGLLVVFAWAFAVQAGMPAPAVPMLLGAGALSGAGRMNLVLAIGAAMLATLGADILWYSLGRARGSQILAVVGRFSLDPESLIRRGKERFSAHRARYLIVAKFLPGVNPLAAGLAGVVPIGLTPFLVFAAAGALLWAAVWIVLGYLFSTVIGAIAARAARFGKPLVIAAAAALIVYLALKYARRHRFLRHLRKARITPAELKSRLETGGAARHRRLENAARHRDGAVQAPGRALDPPRVPARSASSDPQRSRSGVSLRGAERSDKRSDGTRPGFPGLQEGPSSQRGARGLARGWVRGRAAADRFRRRPLTRERPPVVFREPSQETRELESGSQ